MQKIMLALALATTGYSAAHAQATPQQKTAMLAYLKSGAEPNVKDATWTSDTMLKVGMLDNKTPRDGFAQYLCEELASRGIRGVSVQVIDIALLVRSDKWVKLGQARCR